MSYVLLFIFTLASCLQAEPLDLRGCFALARQQAHGLQAAQAELRIAQIGMTAAAAPFYPQLNARGSEILAGDSLSGQRIDAPLRWSPDTYQAELSATWNLFRSGRDWLSLRQATFARDEAHAELWRHEQDLALRVLQGYVDVLKQKKLVALAERTLAQRLDRQTQVKALYASGSASYVNVLSQQVQVSRAQSGISNQRTQQWASEARMNALLGRTPEAELVLADSVANTRVGLWQEPDNGPVLERRKDLQARRSALRVQEIGLKLAWIERLPSLGLDLSFNKDIGAYGRDRSFWTNPDRGDENATWAALASVQIPIFSGFARRAGTARAAEAVERARLSLQEGERQALLEARLAWLELVQEGRNLELNEALVDAATKNLAELQRSYAGGTASLFEVNDADTEQLRAVTEQLGGHYDLQIARARWKRAVGLDILSEEE